MCFSSSISMGHLWHLTIARLNNQRGICLTIKAIEVKLQITTEPDEPDDGIGLLFIEHKLDSKI